MVKNIFLEIEYDGTNYFGWQIQSKERKAKGQTVQEKIQQALKKLFNREVKISYAGRTDRGVHAYSQCINFKIDTNIPLKNIKLALNSLLPSDIFIKRIKKVPLGFHARFNAKSKIYRYIIVNRKKFSVFLRCYAWHLPEKLDLKVMRKAAHLLVGSKDFSCFAKEAKRYKSCQREIKSIKITKRGSFIYIDIEADGFLRNMARNIVRFLVRVGKGKINLDEVNAILERKKTYFNKPAPACGLYLYKVNYG